jgi:GNAT superfamily N-acetyltransferase
LSERSERDVDASASEPQPSLRRTEEIRPALSSDLPACQRLLQANGLDGGETAPTPHLRHVLAQGRVLVAEDGGATVGFAAAVDRGPRTFLTDCFVDPERLGQGVGRRLLDALLDRDRLLDTFASDDPRALPLYARFGMRPLAPLLWLRVESDRVAPLPETVELEPVAPDDAELVALDADIVRAARPAEHALWSRGGAIPHVVRRGGRAVSYAWIGPSTSASRRGIWEVGPTGARSEDDAAAVTLAAVAQACRMGGGAAIQMLGPHPALLPLFQASVRVVDRDTWMATTAYLDPARYVPSLLHG